MTKRYSGDYILRWTDSQGKKQKKLYRYYSDAQKALKWLEDKGCNDADIAVAYVEPEKEKKYNDGE